MHTTNLRKVGGSVMLAVPPPFSTSWASGSGPRWTSEWKTVAW